MNEMGYNSEWTVKEKEKFWKAKWLSEHKTGIIVSLVLTPVVVYIVYARKFIEFSFWGWVLLLLFLWAADLLYFNRRMQEYIRLKLIYEARQDEDHPKDELKEEFYSNLR